MRILYLTWSCSEEWSQSLFGFSIAICDYAIERTPAWHYRRRIMSHSSHLQIYFDIQQPQNRFAYSLLETYMGRRNQFFVRVKACIGRGINLVFLCMVQVIRKQIFSQLKIETSEKPFGLSVHTFGLMPHKFVVNWVHYKFKAVKCHI